MANEIVITLRLTNPKALKALRVIGETLGDLQEDMPWRDDVRRAAKAFRYAVKSLEPIAMGRSPRRLPDWLQLRA